jgi:hypothetical protein
VISFRLYKMSSIISQRGRDVGMVTWNTSDIEHVIHERGVTEEAPAHGLASHPRRLRPTGGGERLNPIDSTPQLTGVGGSIRSLIDRKG